MNVVFTVGSLDPADGGPSRTVPSLCSALLERDVHATIVACVVHGRLHAPPDGTAVRTVRYRSRALRSLWGAPFRREVDRACRATNAALIHDNGLWLQTNHAAATAARHRSLPLVVSPRGMLEPWSLTQGSLRKRLAWRAFARRDLDGAALLHATSTMEAENFRRMGLRQPIAVIPNGIDVEPTPAAPMHCADDRTRIVLFLSRIHPKKGLMNLVSAWSTLRPVGWRVVVAGPDEGGHMAQVQAAARLARVDDCFEFVGAVEGEQKRALLRNADLFLLPTASENFGVVVAEALAAGVPVITTKGTPWDGLETNKCGWWTDVGVLPLSDALRVAISLSDEARREMGERGRRWVNEQFSWRRIGSDMHDAYAWILHGGSTPHTIHCG